MVRKILLYSDFPDIPEILWRRRKWQFQSVMLFKQTLQELVYDSDVCVLQLRN